MDTAPSRWLAHTATTDPGEYAKLLDKLPRNLASVADVVRGLLVHGDCLGMYGLDAAKVEPFSRSTLPVHERLGKLIARGGHDLESQAPSHREIGTCRDFAVLFTSILRTHGVPARCRCGFGSYLGPGWQDHWVSEYWHLEDGTWRLVDAQLGEAQLSAWGITFDPLDVPRTAFLPANKAWAAYRSGQIAPELFGNGDTKGCWFMGVDVVRDSLSLHGHETSPWDTWRQATAGQRQLGGSEILTLDAVARAPELANRPTTPPWLPS